MRLKLAKKVYVVREIAGPSSKLHCRERQGAARGGLCSATCEKCSHPYCRCHKIFIEESADLPTAKYSVSLTKHS